VAATTVPAAMVAAVVLGGGNGCDGGDAVDSM